MSCCARCGREICTTSGKIALNKVWHKNCFCCYNCNCPLHVNNAKIYYGEVFCSCCCPQIQECCPIRVCRVNSTPSFNPDCCPKIMKPTCCMSSDSDNCRPRDVHSCSCIPGCCRRTPSPCNCQECDNCCIKRVQCRPKSPKPLNYPPRQRSPRCGCPKCCPPPPPPKNKSYCIRRKPECRKQNPCDGKKRLIYIEPARANCCCNSCMNERCRRCGEKVFAAEKILTSYGAYHLGCFSCNCCCKSLCMKSMHEACGEIYCKQCYNNYFGISGYGYSC